MPYTLRTDQTLLNDSVNELWGLGLRNVVAVAPTGFGKTVTASHIIAEKARLRWHVMIVAHRQELIEQWALALAMSSVPHTFIAQPHTVNAATDRQHDELKRSFYDSSSSVIVASVDTLKNRNLGKLRDRLDLWVCDEGHHCVTSNKWGRSVSQFPNAFGLGLTATPERADGKGIGRHASGVFDALVTGPSLRECIELGELSDYDVMAPPSDFDSGRVPISNTTGDFIQEKLTTAMDASSVYGDVVQHYITHAYGRSALTFAQGIPACVRLADDFKLHGVPAVALSAKSSSIERAQAKKALRNGNLWQIVNCDLFGEGFDCPAVDVMQDAQPTRSYPRFSQKFGRPLRTDPLKPDKRALLFDHVGNIRPPEGHGLPDHRKVWSLDDRPKRARASAGEVSIRVCGRPGCHHVYSAELVACPYCGWRPTAESRESELAQIEGDLAYLSAAQLDELRGEIQRVSRMPDDFRADLMRGGMPDRISFAATAQHRKRREAQLALRHTLTMWAGLMRHLGLGEIEQQLLVQRFGVNVLAAQVLGRPQAEALTAKLQDDIRAHIAPAQQRATA